VNCSEVKYYLSDYSRGILLDEMRSELHDHLNGCINCSRMLDEIISSGSKRRAINKVKSEKISKAGSHHESEKNKNYNKHPRYVIPSDNTFDDENIKLKNKLFFITNDIDNNKLFAVSAIISTIALGIILAFLIFDSSPNKFWIVEKISGYPVIQSQIMTSQGILKVGEKLITDSESRARLIIASFGEIDIEPQTEIKFIETKSAEYQLFLSKGKISVRTWAAPKLFSIETPSAVIKDFGGIYYLTVDEKFNTKLQVKSGWVLMIADDIKSLLSTASICYADKKSGMGVPFSINATDSFKSALYNFNLETRTGNELSTILSESQKEDLSSLFHLLIRSRNEQREKIFNRIKLLSVIPQQITQDGILNGDKDMLGRLWTQIGLGSISMYQNL
jgi:hypothetical protein